jgi:hypothetical protein
LAILVLASACAPDLPILGSLRGNAAGTVSATSAPGRLAAVAIFPAVSVADLQNPRLPGSIDNDRGLLLGGVGSDLWRAASDPAGEYWMVTDRGPNGQVKPQGGKERRTFPIPEYSPEILHVRVDGSTVEILSSIPIVGRSGRPVTGLPNHESQEVPYTLDAQAVLAVNPRGLDVEGLVRTPSGEFWAVEEYAPSLVQIDANRTVLRRYVPRASR